jgi:anti-sigma regulatory factor (Ser/Thr protein kinase)
VNTSIDRLVRAGPEAARQAREALASLEGGLPAPLVDDLRLLVSELVTNSVRHAHLERDGEIRVEVRVGPTIVRVEVTDPGPGFERREIVPSLYQTSGWGLYFVGEIADRWGVFLDRGTHVWFEMDLANGRELAGSPG